MGANTSAAMHHIRYPLLKYMGFIAGPLFAEQVVTGCRRDAEESSALDVALESLQYAP